jgi:hypothetical protein
MDNAIAAAAAGDAAGNGLSVPDGVGGRAGLQPAVIRLAVSAVLA